MKAAFMTKSPAFWKNTRDRKRRMAKVSHRRILYSAETMLAAGNAQSALKSVQEVLAQDPSHGDALDLMARAYAQMGKWQDAHETIKAFQEVEPESIRGPFLTMAFAENGKSCGRKTLNAAKEVLRLDPQNPTAHYLTAVSQDNLGDYHLAEKAYRNALAFEPDSAEYLASFSDFLSKTNRKQEAQALMQRALELDPDNSEVLIASGTEDLRQGNIEAAKDKALWVLQSDANDRSALQLLVSVKTKKNPIMGIWWLWVSFLERMDKYGRVMFILVLYFGFQIFARTILEYFSDNIQIIVIYSWIALCILTWVGPWVFRRAVERELKQIKVKKF
jgi:Tfp pilus assembly protein PilF